jgi:hypothetical protein
LRICIGRSSGLPVFIGVISIDCLGAGGGVLGAVGGNTNMDFSSALSVELDATSPSSILGIGLSRSFIDVDKFSINSLNVLVSL